MKKLILAAFLGAPLCALGDGLPLDEKGNLACPHTVVALNDSQQEEAVALGSVTLTVEQWQNLRKVSPNTPKRLQGLVPVTHRDCLCGISYDAVQLNANRIAVIHEEQSARSLAWRFRQAASLTFHVDRRGQFYFSGVLTQFPKLMEAIEQSEPYSAKDRPAHPTEMNPGGATIEVPMGMSVSDLVFENRIRRVYDALARKGWNSGRNPLDPAEAAAGAGH